MGIEFSKDVGVEFSKNVAMFDFKSIKEIQEYARPVVCSANSEIGNVKTLKQSSYIKKISKTKNGSYIIFTDKSKKIASGVLHKVASIIRASNPLIDLMLDEDLVNMDHNNELIFKSKNPLWVLKNKGSILTLSRVF